MCCISCSHSFTKHKLQNKFIHRIFRQTERKTHIDTIQSECRLLSGDEHEQNLQITISYDLIGNYLPRYAKLRNSIRADSKSHCVRRLSLLFERKKINGKFKNFTNKREQLVVGINMLSNVSKAKNGPKPYFQCN